MLQFQTTGPSGFTIVESVIVLLYGRFAVLGNIVDVGELRLDQTAEIRRLPVAELELRLNESGSLLFYVSVMLMQDVLEVTDR